MMLLTRLFFIFALLGAASSTVAHPAPFSYLDFHLHVGGIRGSVVIHDFDAAHELGIAKPEMLLDPTVVRAGEATLVRLVESRLRLLADGNAVTVQWGDIEALAERQSLRLPFTLAQPVRGTLDIDVWLFPYDDKHQTFINLYENGELKQQAILDAHRRTLKFYSGSLQGRWAVVSTFVQAGIHHILIGFDHVLFLIGLMLLGGSWWRLAAIVTAFTLGHSITLSLAVLGIVNIAPSIVEPAIALSIVVVGVDNLLVNRQRRLAPSVRQSHDLRPWLAMLFGLIHGFGFAAVLMQFGLPREALGWSLAAFNVGVEAGQLAVVLTTLLLGSVATRVLALALPQTSRTVAERFLTIGSIAVIAAGVYWLVQRIWFAPGA